MAFHVYKSTRQFNARVRERLNLEDPAMLEAAQRGKPTFHLEILEDRGP